MAEQYTFNVRVRGSSPRRPTSLRSQRSKSEGCHAVVADLLDRGEGGRYAALRGYGLACLLDNSTTCIFLCLREKNHDTMLAVRLI